MSDLTPGSLNRLQQTWKAASPSVSGETNPCKVLCCCTTALWRPRFVPPTYRLSVGAAKKAGVAAQSMTPHVPPAPSAPPVWVKHTFSFWRSLQRPPPNPRTRRLLHKRLRRAFTAHLIVKKKGKKNTVAPGLTCFAMSEHISLMFCR